MLINLNDKSKASLRHIAGQVRITFHGLNNHSVLFPAGQEVNLPLVEMLYERLKSAAKCCDNPSINCNHFNRFN